MTNEVENETTPQQVSDDEEITDICCSGRTADRYCRVTCNIIENEVYDSKWCEVVYLLSQFLYFPYSFHNICSSLLLLQMLINVINSLYQYYAL